MSELKRRTTQTLYGKEGLFLPFMNATVFPSSSNTFCLSVSQAVIQHTVVVHSPFPSVAHTHKVQFFLFAMLKSQQASRLGYIQAKTKENCT